MEKAAADTVFLHGGVFQGAGLPPARTLAARAGRIVHVGDDAAAWIGPETEIVDLSGRWLIPSFFEGHAHPTFVVEHDFRVWLCGAPSPEDYVERVRRYLDERPGLHAVKGYGWDNALFGPEGPSRHALDAVSRTVPIALHSYDHHALWVNTRALELACIDRAFVPPEGAAVEREADGFPSGTLREDGAMNAVLSRLPDYSVDEYKIAILNYQAMAHMAGFTGVLDAMVAPDGHAYHAYRALRDEGRLRMYFRLAFVLDPTTYREQIAWIAETMASSPPPDNDDPLIARTAKFFVDGVMEGRTAYLLEPYADCPGWSGRPVWNADALNDAYAHCVRAGLGIHNHAIGDGAVRLALDALARLPRGRRDGITHLQLVADADLARFARENVVAFVNPYWAMKEPTFEAMEGRLLGARAERMYPVGSIARAGAVLASSSDYPITLDPDPLFGMEVAMRRQAPGRGRPLNPAEALDFDAALASFTTGPVWAQGMETVTGRLAEGFSADMVLLSADISAPDVSPTDAVVESTYFQGKRVFPAPSGVPFGA